MDVSGFFEFTGSLMWVFFIIALAIIVIFEYETSRKKTNE